MRGPGEVYIRAREFGERRVAKDYGRRAGDMYAHLERREAGKPYSDPAHRYKYSLSVRRKTDERRHTTVKEKILAGIFGCDIPRRRKGEDRRMMQRRALTVMFMLGGKRKATADRRAGPQGERYKLPADVERRSPDQFPGRPSKNNILGRWYGRRKGDERRDPHMKGVHYTSSRDPRIVALERRGKILTFRRYTGIDEKDKT